jgi:RHS repeat-associated protein
MTTSTSVHSNAFNFMSFLQNGVDPRTGQYTLSIALPDVKSNGLRGPGVPLNLGFNPLNTQDNGYGFGWSLQLSEYDPGRQILSLSTGENFKVTGSSSSGGRLLMEEQKIDSFHFYQDDETHYRVMHKSGQVEILEKLGSVERSVALPVRIFEPSGHAITLDYLPFSSTHQLLSSIKDDQENTLLEIRREDSSIEYLLHPYASPEGEPLARFVMTLQKADKLVSEITLPTENSASWRLDYDTFHGHMCLTAVDTPSGAHEDIFYLDDGHAFPTSSTRKFLPRVTRHVTRPGSGQPEIDVRYTYDHEQDGLPVQHSFLGSGLSISWDDEGRDNLYKHPGEYDYVCTETLFVDEKPVRSIERKFNRFHLLTREVTTQARNIQTEETTYNLSPDASFNEQPNTCQLPHEVKTTWRIEGEPTRVRSESVTSTYDASGNLREQKQANGVIETSTWYLAAGEDGCPPDPDGFVRQLKDRTVTAAHSPYGEAPTLVTRYRYKSLPAMAGSQLKGWLVTESETLVQTAPDTEPSLQSTDFEYINDLDEPFQHGRVAKQVVTMGDKATTTAYVYSTLANPELGESVQRTVQTLTGFDGEKKEITLEHSLLTGEPLLNRDDNDVEIRYLYDNLRRVLRETVAPGTGYEACRRYEYYLCASPADVAQQWLFDVKGVKTCTRFDGLHRAVFEERDDVDNPSRAVEPRRTHMAVNDPWGNLSKEIQYWEVFEEREGVDNPARVVEPRQTYSAVYDSWGNLAEETQYDWMYVEAADGRLDVKPLALTTSVEYDDWGHQRCVTGPDGVKTFEEIDPIGTRESLGPIQRSWTEGSDAMLTKSGVTETWLNLFEKPARIERFDLTKASVSLTCNHYDGLGRTVEKIVHFPEVERKTLNTYDAFDRLTEITLPDEAIVRRSYAAYTSEDLPTLISVEGNGKTRVLGEQTFDGLDRMITSKTGGRERLLNYDPGQAQPKTVTTPGGNVIGYEYLPQLGEEPLQRRLPGATAAYEYDPQNARLLKCVEQDENLTPEQSEQLTMEYYSTGDLKSERRMTAGGEYTMGYRYSRLGRLQSYTDVLGQEQTYDFDDAGRLEKTVLGTTTSAFTYDPLGRTASITTTDSASGKTVSIGLQYDDFGREILRTFNLDGTERTLAQTYDESDATTQRTLTEGAVVIRDEVYRYDRRGRLVRYDCEKGTERPVDPDGKIIRQQQFNFDALDNLILVFTSFDSGSKRGLYAYEGDDPVQLSKVTFLTSILKGGEEVIEADDVINLAYDADGNLISDEAGRSLKYDALGRLIEVGTNPTGSQYRYDPLDKLSSETRNSEQDQRFYRDDELANQLKGSQNSTFMRGDDHLLAERQGSNTLLFGVNGHNSVLNEVTANAVSPSAYTAYGHRSDKSPALSKLGFNGELYEAGTGWQLLGSGYRAYNPLLMRFHSPDSLSPFGEGGMNAYAYCEGDPVNFVDPTGHGLFTPLKLLARLIKPVVMSNSSKAARVPSLLKSVPEGKEVTRLSKIKQPFVNRLEDVADYRKGLVERPNIPRSTTSQENMELTRLSERSLEAEKAYDFAKNNVGDYGVSRYAKKKVDLEWKQLRDEAMAARQERRAAYKNRSVVPGNGDKRQWPFDKLQDRDRFNGQ